MGACKCRCGNHDAGKKRKGWASIPSTWLYFLFAVCVAALVTATMVMA